MCCSSCSAATELPFMPMSVTHLLFFEQCPVSKIQCVLYSFIAPKNGFTPQLAVYQYHSLSLSVSDLFSVFISLKTGPSVVTLFYCQTFKLTTYCMQLNSSSLYCKYYGHKYAHMCISALTRSLGHISTHSHKYSNMNIYMHILSEKA